MGAVEGKRREQMGFTKSTGSLCGGTERAGTPGLSFHVCKLGQPHGPFGAAGGTKPHQVRTSPISPVGRSGAAFPLPLALSPNPSSISLSAPPPQAWPLEDSVAKVLPSLGGHSGWGGGAPRSKMDREEFLPLLQPYSCKVTQPARGRAGAGLLPPQQAGPWDSSGYLSTLWVNAWG